MIVGLVVSNLLYPVIAIGVAAVVCIVIALAHRRPKSAEAHMKAFHKGLRALAPEDADVKASRRQPVRRVAVPLEPTLPSSFRRRVAATTAKAATPEGAEAETG